MTVFQVLKSPRPWFPWCHHSSFFFGLSLPLAFGILHSIIVRSRLWCLCKWLFSFLSFSLFLFEFVSHFFSNAQFSIRSFVLFSGHGISRMFYHIFTSGLVMGVSVVRSYLTSIGIYKEYKLMSLTLNSSFLTSPGWRICGCEGIGGWMVRVVSSLSRETTWWLVLARVCLSMVLDWCARVLREGI